MGTRWTPSSSCPASTPSAPVRPGHCQLGEESDESRPRGVRPSQPARHASPPAGDLHKIPNSYSSTCCFALSTLAHHVNDEGEQLAPEKEKARPLRVLRVLNRLFGEGREGGALPNQPGLRNHVRRQELKS